MKNKISKPKRDYEKIINRKEKSRIYIFRYHSRDARILTELINIISKGFDGKFIGLEDQNEISFHIPYLFSWNTPKKFVMMELVKEPDFYCSNCNLPITRDLVKIFDGHNFKKIICKSCELDMGIIESGKFKNFRLSGKENKNVEDLAFSLTSESENK